MVTWILAMASSATAYDWGIGPPGPNFNYHICTGNFTAAEKSEIEKGGNAWDAGPGEVLRGAHVEVTRDTDRSNCGIGNANNEVYMRSPAWFGNHFCGATNPSCTLFGGLDIDIAFNSDETWCTSTPAVCNEPGSDLSIGQAMAHEMGHKIGFNHENDVIATMNEFYPFGGDLSNVKYRIHEDDSVGLQDHKSDSSTGINLMLAKFSYDGDGEADEVWNAQSQLASWTWDLSNGTWDFGDAPGQILAVIEGTSSASPVIQWRLVAVSDAECFDGQGVEYIVGERTLPLGPNTPARVNPSPWDFTGVLPGDYELCAQIDVGNNINETNDSGPSDNDLRSEGFVRVEL